MSFSECSSTAIFNVISIWLWPKQCSFWLIFNAFYINTKHRYIWLPLVDIRNNIKITYRSWLDSSFLMSMRFAIKIIFIFSIDFGAIRKYRLYTVYMYTVQCVWRQTSIISGKITNESSMWADKETNRVYLKKFFFDINH